MAVPLDEYPIHQVPMSMRYVASSDRNAYDRCIYHAFDAAGDTLVICGLGVYPNLGVIDAFFAVRRGTTIRTVRFSSALSDDRLSQQVGGFRVEVIEPLRHLRLVCESAEHGIEADLHWRAVSPPIDEPQHISRTGDKLILEGCRFAQSGSVSGRLRVDDRDVTVEDWIGTRDRSWGIRPVGEPEPAGRGAAEFAITGFYWLWIPLRFDDFTIMVIAQDQPDGSRALNDARRIWHDPDRGVDQLGWPEFDITYRSGTRHPERATIHLTDRRTRTPLVIEVQTITNIPLSIGCGYGPDPDWAHGQWKGRDFVLPGTYDLTDPAVAGRAGFSVTDHVAQARLGDREGRGIFEHGTFGRHDPSGFTDFFSVAP
jgi:hypothetical protein